MCLGSIVFFKGEGDLPSYTLGEVLFGILSVNEEIDSVIWEYLLFRVFLMGSFEEGSSLKKIGLISTTLRFLLLHVLFCVMKRVTSSSSFGGRMLLFISSNRRSMQQLASAFAS